MQLHKAMGSWHESCPMCFVTILAILSTVRDLSFVPSVYVWHRILE